MKYKIRNKRLSFVPVEYKIPKRNLLLKFLSSYNPRILNRDCNNLRIKKGTINNRITSPIKL